VAASAAIAVAGPATAQTGAITAYGSLSNFDVFNDDPDGREAEGFDIEIEGVSAADILGEYIYNRYGGVSIIPYDNTPTGGKTGVIVRYAATWNGTAWTLPAAFSGFGNGTPYVNPNSITPTMGHQCVYGATANYATSGCEHYGVALAYQPNISKITYYWLYDTGVPQGLSGQLAGGSRRACPRSRSSATTRLRPASRRSSSSRSRPSRSLPQRRNSRRRSSAMPSGSRCSPAFRRSGPLSIVW
jgi:hypothetical protein